MKKGRRFPKTPFPKRVYIYDGRTTPQPIAFALDMDHEEYDSNNPRHSGLGALADTGINWYDLKKSCIAAGAEVTLSPELQSDEQDMNDGIDQGDWPFDELRPPSKFGL